MYLFTSYCLHLVDFCKSEPIKSNVASHSKNDSDPNSIFFLFIKGIYFIIPIS